MILLLLITAITIAVFAVFEDYLKDNSKWAVYLTIGIALILTAALRPVGFDRDSENYEEFFFNNDDTFIMMSVEYSYILLSRFFLLFTDDVHAVFFVYALIGISTKLFAIQKLSPMVFLPMVIYIGNIFFVQDMTQIRAGAASGFVLLAVYYICEKRKGLACLFMLCALFFHYSSLALFPLLLLNNKEMSMKFRIALMALIPVCYLIYFAHINIFTALPIPYISEKIELYQELTERGIDDHDQINVFNLVFLTKIIIFAYLMYFYDTIIQYNKYITTLLQFEALSIFSFIAFATLPVMAFRLSDMFGIVDIILFPNIYYTIKQSTIAKITVSFIGLTLLCINLFYIELFEF